MGKRQGNANRIFITMCAALGYLIAFVHAWLLSVGCGVLYPRDFGRRTFYFIILLQAFTMILFWIVWFYVFL